MSEQVLPVDDPDEYEPDVYLRMWREKWGENSPWDVILRGDCDSFDDKRISLDAIHRADLFQAYEAASWIVASLANLEDAYGDYVWLVGQGDSSRVVRRQFLEHLAWFCLCLHDQVISGDWKSLAAVEWELASVRTRPARIGRRRYGARQLPEIDHYGPSMTGLTALIHRHAFRTIHMAEGGVFFNAAMSVVPEELRHGGPDTSAFARAVALAWRGQKLDPADTSLAATWREVHETLRVSQDFQRAAERVGMEPILDFIRRDLRTFRNPDRVRAEIKIEFGRAAQQRLALHIPLRSREPEARQQRPRTLSDEWNIRAREYLINNREREGTENRVTVRELANAIGCSEGKTTGLPAWRVLMEERRKRSPKRPRAVSLSDKVLASEGRDDESLRRLIDEAEADWEPSPLDCSARSESVKSYKNL
jgi:hypothetical protein